MTLQSRQRITAFDAQCENLEHLDQTCQIKMET